MLDVVVLLDLVEPLIDTLLELAREGGMFCRLRRRVVDTNQPKERKINFFLHVF